MKADAWQPGELSAYFKKAFPMFRFELLEGNFQEGVGLKYFTSEKDLREGNTILGPVQFAVADAACYAAILAQIGKETAIVTSSLSIQFLSPPSLQNLICLAVADKIGRRLCFVRFEIRSEDQTQLFAHGICTYAR